MMAISTSTTTVFMPRESPLHHAGAAQGNCLPMPNPDRLDGTPDPDPGAAAPRFRPRLLPTLVTIVAVAVFVSAGNWQRDRMHAKEALRARYDAATGLPPATLSEVKAEAA